MKQSFFICKHCGNIVTYIRNSGVPVMCCGEKMSEIKPNTVEASKEKHIPKVEVEGNRVTVTVGDIVHPSTPEHYIMWISLESKEGCQHKELLPGQTPAALFELSKGDAPTAVYAYCNLHGLWVKEV